MLSKLLKYPLFYVMLTIFLIGSCKNALDHENPENQLVSEIIRDTIIQIDTIFKDRIVELIIKDTVNQIDTIYLDLHGNEIDFENAILFERVVLDGEFFEINSVFSSDEIEFYYVLDQNTGNQKIMHEFEFRLYRNTLPQKDFPFLISTIEIDASYVPLSEVVDLTRPQHNLRKTLIITTLKPELLPFDFEELNNLSVDFRIDRLSLPDREVLAIWISASAYEVSNFVYSFDLTFFKELD